MLGKELLPEHFGCAGFITGQWQADGYQGFGGDGALPGETGAAGWQFGFQQAYRTAFSIGLRLAQCAGREAGAGGGLDWDVDLSWVPWSLNTAMTTPCPAVSNPAEECRGRCHRWRPPHTDLGLVNRSGPICRADSQGHHGDAFGAFIEPVKVKLRALSGT